jgi:hypothetical protein
MGACAALALAGELPLGTVTCGTAELSTASFSAAQPAKAIAESERIETATTVLFFIINGLEAWQALVVICQTAVKPM